MARLWLSAGRTLRIALTCLCLVFMPVGGASAQSGMQRAEAAQLYSAAGFSIRNDQPVNRCGKPAKPGVTFMDLNGDKRPEALFVDANAACYVGSGRYFAVLVKDGTSWRTVIRGTGSIEALSSKTVGWLDMRVSDSSCVRDHRFDGRTYTAATTCSGQAVATAPRAAQRARGAVPDNAQRAPGTVPDLAQRATGTVPDLAQQAPGTVPDKIVPRTLQSADEAAVFKAAGFTKRGSAWRSGCNDPGTASYSPGAIDKVDDLNGDGLQDVVLTEGGTYCYGNTGQGYWLVSKLANGGWRLMTHGTGIPEFLKTKGAGGWPDMSIGGPGFCFPVARWNGREYKFQRWEYEGKACKAPR